MKMSNSVSKLDFVMDVGGESKEEMRGPEVVVCTCLVLHVHKS